METMDKYIPIIKCDNWNRIVKMKVIGFEPLSLHLECKYCYMNFKVQFKDCMKGREIILKESEEFKEQVQKVKYAEEYLNQYYPYLKSTQTNLDENSQNTLNKAYEKGLQSNKEIINFLKALLMDYNKDYPESRENIVIHFKKIFFNKIKQNPSLEEVICFFKTNHIYKMQEESNYNVNSKEHEYGINIVKKISAHYSRIQAICIMENQRIATGGSDKTIKIFSTINYQCILTILAHKKEVSSLVSLDDRRLLSSSSDCTIRTWLIIDNMFRCLSIFTTHEYNICEVLKLSENEIISFGGESKLKVWDINKAECKTEFQLTGYGTIGFCLIKEKKNILLSVRASEGINLFDLEKKNKYFNLPGIGIYTKYSICQIGDNKILICDIGIINIFDFEMKQVVSTIKGRDCYYFSSSLSFNDDEVICGDIYGSLHLVNTKELKIRVFHRLHSYGWITSIIRVNENLFASICEKDICFWEVK